MVVVVVVVVVTNSGPVGDRITEALLDWNIQNMGSVVRLPTLDHPWVDILGQGVGVCQEG